MTTSTIDETTDYARQVVTGKIVAGKYVVLACERHLRDLDEGPARGLTWRPDLADRAIRFFPAVLSITAGALEGEPFELLPWQKFTVGSLYGWRDVNDLRRFRWAWLETGKGQAKSPLMGAIGIYEIVGRKTPRAEVYAIGEDKKTANVLFSDAVAMAHGQIPGKRRGESLVSTGRIKPRGVGDNTYKLEHPSSGSKFEPVANTDAISGPRPVAVLGDEIHEMKSTKSIEIWRSAIAKMPGDPVMILGTNTPSVDQQVGTQYSEVAQRVLRGEIKDDSLFAYIARVDKGDDPFNDEGCWIKALPALGITYPRENVRKQVDSARHMISTSLTTKRLYFGIPVGTAGFWISEDAWQSTQAPVDEEEMRGRRLHLSLDLAQKNDLTALSGCWEGERLAVKTWYWTCEARISEREIGDQIPYRELKEEGEITITPTATIDYAFVAEEVKGIMARHDVVQLVVDSAYLAEFIDGCEEAGLQTWIYEGPKKPAGTGLKIVRHAQGNKIVFKDEALSMPVSIRQLEDHILKGSVVIDNRRLTTTCASNVVMIEDAFKNKAFAKHKSRGRIDGMVTIAMAVGAATSAMEGGPGTIDDYLAFLAGQ